jgi:hypothetical protein
MVERFNADSIILIVYLLKQHHRLIDVVPTATCPAGNACLLASFEGEGIDIDQWRCLASQYVPSQEDFAFAFEQIASYFKGKSESDQSGSAAAGGGL